ncbi:MAG TPA: YcxB family protein [Pyrinomonadaceae bacterium]|jgi:uncharacterized integral membrane protein
MSPENKFEATVEVTAEDYRRILFWYHKTRLIIYGIFIAVFSLPATLGIIFVLSQGQVKTPQIFLFLIFPILLPFFILGLTVFKIRKQAQSIVKTTEPTKFTFTEDGLTAVSDPSTVQTKWSRFHGIKETKTDFIFFPQENIFYPIPKRFFDNEIQVNQLRNFVRES